MTCSTWGLSLFVILWCYFCLWELLITVSSLFSTSYEMILYWSKMTVVLQMHLIVNLFSSHPLLLPLLLVRDLIVPKYLLSCCAAPSSRCHFNLPFQVQRWQVVRYFILLLLLFCHFVWNCAWKLWKITFQKLFVCSSVGLVSPWPWAKLSFIIN